MKLLITTNGKLPSFSTGQESKLTIILNLFKDIPKFYNSQEFSHSGKAVPAIQIALTAFAVLPKRTIIANMISWRV